MRMRGPESQTIGWLELQINEDDSARPFSYLQELGSDRGYVSGGPFRVKVSQQRQQERERPRWYEFEDSIGIFGLCIALTPP